MSLHFSDALSTYYPTAYKPYYIQSFMQEAAEETSLEEHNMEKPSKTINVTLVPTSKDLSSFPSSLKTSHTEKKNTDNNSSKTQGFNEVDPQKLLMGFPNLSKEINYKILQFLPIDDMPQVAGVCKLWNAFLKEKVAFTILCKKISATFPKEMIDVFGSVTVIAELPRLNLNYMIGEYGPSVKKMDEPVMLGEDSKGKLFLAIKVFKKNTQDSFWLSSYRDYPYFVSLYKHSNKFEIECVQQGDWKNSAEDIYLKSEGKINYQNLKTLIEKKKAIIFMQAYDPQDRCQIKLTLGLDSFIHKYIEAFEKSINTKNEAEAFSQMESLFDALTSNEDYYNMKILLESCEKSTKLQITRFLESKSLDLCKSNDNKLKFLGEDILHRLQEKEKINISMLEITS